jgi:hypothetical protein
MALNQSEALVASMTQQAQALLNQFGSISSSAPNALGKR